MHHPNPYIKKYWILENTSTNQAQALNPMISDGHLELLFIEGNGVKCQLGNSAFSLPAGIYFTGQLSGQGALCLLPESKLHFLKLQQWAPILVSKFPFSTLSNQIVSLAELNRGLYEKLKNFNPSTAMNTILAVLLVELETAALSNTNFHTLQQACLAFMAPQYEFRAQKKAILTDLKISDRTLENKFKQHVGLTPKQFSMTVRMRHIAEDLIYQPREGSLTDLAFSNGFFDQSHFIRSFKAIFGHSPRQLELDTYFIPNSKESFRYYTI